MNKPKIQKIKKFIEDHKLAIAYFTGGTVATVSMLYAIKDYTLVDKNNTYLEISPLTSKALTAGTSFIYSTPDGEVMLMPI